MTQDLKSILFADGFEEAFIGIGVQFNKIYAIYDWDECVDILRERDEMSYGDAVEFMNFKVTGEYVGKNTPVFLKKCSIAEVSQTNGDISW
jgi:hypothetical protein